VRSEVQVLLDPPSHGTLRDPLGSASSVFTVSPSNRTGAGAFVQAKQLSPWMYFSEMHRD